MTVNCYTCCLRLAWYNTANWLPLPPTSFSLLQCGWSRAINNPTLSAGGSVVDTASRGLLSEGLYGATSYKEQEEKCDDNKKRNKKPHRK